MATAFNTIDFNSAIVDRLGDIKAQIADLKKIEADLVARITEVGADAIDGRIFRATVSAVAERSSLDAKAAEAKLRELGVDGRWFAKNQKVAKGYTTVKVVARKA
jgi:N-methylhydantoinase B/oxoprolinase/acetone carboxylase alpha subunit